MQEQLKTQIAQAPKQAGVYQFLDDLNKALYVGKAKNLRNRLKSYLDKTKHNSRISKMISLATKLEIIITDSESEALLLECNLIKKLMPRYNILLRDDKSFANILVDTSHPFPAVVKHRGNIKEENGKKYFGPFANNQAIYDTIDHLKKIFLLRSCSDSEFKNRKKPCMEYQIKRCSAPCVGMIKQEDYGQSIKEVLDFLAGKKAYLQEDLAKLMQEHSNNLEFEKALVLRDRIKALSAIQAKQNIHLKHNENIDFIALTKQGVTACVVISFFRNGNNYGSKPYFLNVSEDDLENEIMDTFLEQFYSEKKLPDSIILSHQTIFDAQVEKLVPKQGEKFNLLKNYLNLAQEELQKHLVIRVKDLEMLVELKRIFDLQKIPERIEIYDNSHTSGQFAVGAFVASGRDGFIKNAYRKFTIRVDELDKKDDCSFLKQVLKRRFKKDSESNTYPDLIIIDGGKAQLNAANQVFKEIGIEIKFIAMSKGKNRNAGEEDFHQVDQHSFTLPKHSPLMHYLQRMRDEAHRFVIGFNRKVRGKSVYKSELDEMSGIGSKRKMILLNHFGSLAAIREAKIQDLLLVKGISKNTAIKIADYFAK